MSNKVEQLHQQLRERILVLDGGMGTMIQGYRLSEQDFRGERFADWPCDLKGNNDLLVLSKPEVIREIHDASFRRRRGHYRDQYLQLDNHRDGGLPNGIPVGGNQLCRRKAGPRQPRRVDRAYAGKTALCGGGCSGPTNRTASISPDVNDPAFRNITFDQLVAAYRESTKALVEGGSDLILIETVFDTLNAKAAIFAVKEEFEALGVELPIMISGTITDASGRTLSGRRPKRSIIRCATPMP